MSKELEVIVIGPKLETAGASRVLSIVRVVSALPLGRDGVR
jgi:hypothetical protein